MKIVLCSSAAFFERLKGIAVELEKRKYHVYLHSMVNYHGLEEDALSKIHYDLIKEHFRKIDHSDAVYVANYKKNSINGYIGGNVFLEMGHAFSKDIPIFLMHDIPIIGYREEIKAMNPFVVQRGWRKLERILNDYWNIKEEDDC